MASMLNAVKAVALVVLAASIPSTTADGPSVTFHVDAGKEWCVGTFQL